MNTLLTLTQDDNDLIVMLSASAGCSLDASPGKNWVERSGGLPNYICKVAKGVMKSGKSKSQAIAIAVSRIKKWAAGGDDVEADTQAKATKALAQWEALKVKNKAKKVSLARRVGDDAEYLMFSNVSVFNTEIVRRAFENIERQKRSKEYDARGLRGAYDVPTMTPYTWIKEVWTDHLVVSIEGGPDNDMTFARIDYTVDENDEVTFAEPVPMKQVWVEEDESELSENERALIADLLDLSHVSPAAQRITALASTLRT